MHIILGVIGIATAAYFLVIRARNAAEMSHELMDVANDVRLAARRFGFRRHRDTHPADGIDDPKLAISTIAVGFLELSALPTQEDKERLSLSLRKTLGYTEEEAEEALILGHWIVNQCNGAQAAISRVSRSLSKMGAQDHWTDLLSTLKSSLPSDGSMTTQQSEALEDITRAFRIR